MPSPTAEQLQNLIIYVRDLLGDANTDEFDCPSLISDRQIVSALDDTREIVRYEHSQPVHNYSPGGGLDYKSHLFERFLADNAILLDASYFPLDQSEIIYSNPLRGEFETAVSRLTVYITGDRYDPYLASANLLRQLRIMNRGRVDTSEMGISLKLSQSLGVMESVEKSYRQSARIVSITFGRSDIA